MEAGSFSVKVEALDKRKIQLDAIMRLLIEEGKIMLYLDPKWGSCLKFDCNVQSYESTKRGNITDHFNRGVMQELKEDRKTLMRNMPAYASKEKPEDG